LDFYSLAAKLAIELDGGGHNYQLPRLRDWKRSNLLADQGSLCWVVVQFELA
jgi:very-short-patch-repair endonuclease